MNIQKHRASIWNSFLSVLVLGVFIVVALGSFGATTINLVEEKYLGEGVYEVRTFYDDDNDKEVTQTGKKDKYNRWHGPCKIVADYDDFMEDVEEVEMVNGKRNGRSKYTIKNYHNNPPTERVYYYCYNMGNRVKCGKSAFNNSTDCGLMPIIKATTASKEIPLSLHIILFISLQFPLVGPIPSIPIIASIMCRFGILI